ncbi:hypothetical protein PtrSN002B_005450 [Pyrenophora tritici-repentis]|uniref:Tymo-45kd-70kd domain containing protein n=2 Tax=Pyrenophora tritici-repentis TaxID=45151 RepID=A0A2W1ENJ8_9PLEO|nr:uncharacterized protein PTRG_05603 [Pyrenophora tritici-repentis Pt-1C-BFP]KAA8618668.1 hypothetical protein PtrV1_08097 [Pyrenophora tritici-repentis]EDU48523.1 conserved hypothetical protein [Pyrenophora tritici-repentis Pt-1C-BFP]KAF7449142.1 hypothetical protein A1F99_061910 [Pyrenophora tritici-repentis]KAF7570855.1 Tymo-45kd-70kd domain containing protein [Pyrenophora tritici-repentis]KAG9383920.1 hypothetical protein A1F94_005831 [Pyrenophora tritici-repentis]
MLQRLHNDMVDENVGKLERKRSKRQRVLRFFTAWKQKQPHEVSTLSKDSQPLSRQVPAISSISAPEPVASPVQHGRMPSVKEGKQERVVTPPPQETVEEKAEPLSESQLRSLFAGAPRFGLTKTDSRSTPTVAYPWNTEPTTKHATDSAPLAEPAFSAATLQKHLPKTEQVPGASKQYNGYGVDVVELPNMLGAQGIEAGTIGFSHFLELPNSDVLVNASEQSQSGNGYLSTSTNKDVMQANPERLGIRPVELGLIYDRLLEFQDLYETFHDSPEPMTILNNQSSGDLYANLFTKFLTPPGYDDSTEDPTGLQTQIAALLRVLALEGVWYDFSLVEWRIRLGQILWNEPEPTSDFESRPLWAEREILLLQITLACELLLRLDAFTNADASNAGLRQQINPKDMEAVLQMKTTKIDWDLILARRFLDNILIMRGSDIQESPQPRSRGFLSLLAQGIHPGLPQSDLILLPQHQARQFSGLLHFANTIQWPNIDVVSTDLARKLGAQDDSTEGNTPSSPSIRPFDSNTPSGISVYGTPLETPLPAGHQLDSYFGHVGKPSLHRNNSRALRMPLSPMATLPETKSKSSLNNVGGWLSRSYLAGLVLPGEAISHFLMSTLLENDSTAIANLGDSANLYGGFTFGGRTFWSRNSVVGRTLACVKGSTECMGWVSCPKLPENGGERWYSIHSEVLSNTNRLRVRDGSDLVTQDSAIVPGYALDTVKSEDFVLPRDLDPIPTSSLAFSQWELVPMNVDLIDGDNWSGPQTESDVHAPSMTFILGDAATNHTITLTYDVQFVTSWPCTTPASALSQLGHRPKVMRRSVTGTLSRSSSKHTMSRRNSHGFEPLLSHPPDAEDLTPKRMYDPPETEADALATISKPMNIHPLHSSYSHQVVPVTDVLDPKFVLPFALHTSKSSERLLRLSNSKDSDEETIKNNKKAVLVLDARSSPDLELLARAWCAENGLHAIISRVERTCLGCSIREARGLGINIVIRV